MAESENSTRLKSVVSNRAGTDRPSKKLRLHTAKAGGVPTFVQGFPKLYLLLTVNTGRSIFRCMKHPVENERGNKFVGLPEFAAVCERVMSVMDLEQVRGTVTNVPDERTIRYYLGEGLIQPADEKQGTASVFGYVHLLQLVAVKKLQAEHLPIRKIRELVVGKSERELESLLGIGIHGGKQASETEAKRYLESLLAPSMSPPARAMSEKRLTGPPMLSVQAPSAPLRHSSEPSGVWQRLEIEPGLELHIRSDYAPPPTSARTRGLVDKIRAVINRYRREK